MQNQPVSSQTVNNSMRDLIDILNNALTESAGGMSKRWLESQKSPVYFLDDQGNRYTIHNLLLFPEEETKVPIQQLGTELESTIDKLGLTKQDIQFVNAMPAKNGAGMLIIMKNQNGLLFPYFKFFNQRSMDSLGMHWPPADFERETGLSWEQTRMSGSGKNRKEEVISRIDLKPSASVPTNRNISIASVPVESGTMLAANDRVGPDLAKKLQQLLTNTLAGSSAPVAGLESYERDIKVDYGEVAAPLGLVAGKFVGGNYSKVQTDLLAPLGVSWGSATQVFYPTALNEPLYDSQIMWSNGERLRISNKAEGKGGAASTTSVLEIIDRYPERFSQKDQDMLAPGGKYGKFITALRTIVAVKSFEGPVRLAQEFGFITDQDAANALENLANKSNDIKLLTPTLQKIVQDTSIFNAKTELPDYKISYHVIASLARMAVKYLNSDIALTTDFFKFMLSRANLVQVNQFTTRSEAGVAFSKFDVIWPPVFTGKIKFSASDFQSNKKPTSRLAFSVGNEKSTAKDNDQTQEPSTGVTAKTSVADLDAVTNTGSGIKASGQPDVTTSVATPAGDAQSLGRARRRR